MAKRQRMSYLPSKQDHSPRVLPFQYQVLQSKSCSSFCVSIQALGHQGQDSNNRQFTTLIQTGNYLLCSEKNTSDLVTNGGLFSPSGHYEIYSSCISNHTAKSTLISENAMLCRPPTMNTFTTNARYCHQLAQVS